MAYWREHFASPHAALTMSRKAARGNVYLSPAQRMSAMHALGELPETAELGSLKSFLKKTVKIATKLSPSHQIAKAISPKLLALSPSHALAEKLSQTSAPKTPPTAAVATEAPAPVTAPVAPLDFSSQALPFAQSGGGGGGGGFAPAPAAAEAPAETNWLLIGGIGAAGLLVLYLLMKKRR